MEDRYPAHKGSIRPLMRRPPGLLAIGIIYIAFAAAYAIGGIKYIQVALQGQKAGGTEPGAAWSMAAVILTFALVNAWVAVGIFRRQNWARSMGIFFAFMNMVGVIMAGGPWWKMASLFGSAACIIYLMAPEAKRWFRNDENYPDRMDRAA